MSNQIIKFIYIYGKLTDIILHINTIKQKIISVNAGKPCDEIQYPFIIKTLNKLKIKRNFLNIKKKIANVTLNSEKTGYFPLKICCEARLFSFNTLIQNLTGREMRKRKGLYRFEGIQ